MYEWPRLIQGMVDEIDRSILAHEEETLTLQRLSRDMGYINAPPGGCAPGAIPASRATVCGCPPATTARCRRRWS